MRNEVVTIPIDPTGGSQASRRKICHIRKVGRCCPSQYHRISRRPDLPYRGGSGGRRHWFKGHPSAPGVPLRPLRGGDRVISLAKTDPLDRRVSILPAGVV